MIGSTISMPTVGVGKGLSCSCFLPVKMPPSAPKCNLLPMVEWSFVSFGVVAFGAFGKKWFLITVEKAEEKHSAELTRLPNIETWGTVPFEHTHAPLLCCKPVHHDLPNIETRGDWLACTYVHQQKSAKNRQNPHHSLEPNWIQMTREGYGWLLHSCRNDRYPLNVRIYHDSFPTLVLQWSPLAWQIHVCSSVSPHFTHALST